MADITSGTVNATPLGDLWIGTLEHASSTAADVVGLQEIMGMKIAGVVWAQENAGTVASTFSSTSGSVTLVSGGSTSLFFVAQSKSQ